MHRYLRAIGFSEFAKRERRRELLMDVIKSSEKRGYTLNRDGVMIAEFCKEYAPGAGIAVCGEFDENDRFVYDYYFPYFSGTNVTSYNDISVERHAAKESFAGVCEDPKLGISIIFYLQNRIPYVKLQAMDKLPVRGTSLTLSALSVSGTILLPMYKDEEQVRQTRQNLQNRMKLIAAAREGDEEAMETLTMEDMDVYRCVTKKAATEDIFTLVDTCFMPYGVECDQYSIVGEILQLQRVRNQFSGEELYIIKVSCNDLEFDVCINEKDLYGEPKAGRRFKGSIWMQGNINFPEGEV